MAELAAAWNQRKREPGRCWGRGASTRRALVQRRWKSWLDHAVNGKRPNVGKASELENAGRIVVDRTTWHRRLRLAEPAAKGKTSHSHGPDQARRKRHASSGAFRRRRHLGRDVVWGATSRAESGADVL